GHARMPGGRLLELRHGDVDADEQAVAEAEAERREVGAEAATCVDSGPGRVPADQVERVTDLVPLRAAELVDRRAAGRRSRVTLEHEVTIRPSVHRHHDPTVGVSPAAAGEQQTRAKTVGPPIATSTRDPP